MTAEHDHLEELVVHDQTHECGGFGESKVCVRIVGVADLPTRFGHFKIVGFWNNREAKDHVAIVHGDVVGGERVATRLHSECLTGDALGSLRCDCRDQLEAALKRIAETERGVVLYLRQEGRGIGLMNKIRAYALQDRGLDTVEANLALGFRDDERDYSIAAHMLMSLKIRSIALMTNNPNKVDQLQKLGINVAERVPHLLPPNPHNRFYLETKKNRSGHQIDFESLRVAEQADPVVVEDPEGHQ
ncbi:MAG: GTP cyclohydrolase II [Deltaproteobacteria bacterium]|jgi:GTP cyclohydrolase II|nr:GTP cyclohydrolase II [Deltaproteobacteria bacterium]